MAETGFPASLSERVFGEGRNGGPSVGVFLSPAWSGSVPELVCPVRCDSCSLSRLANGIARLWDRVEGLLDDVMFATETTFYTCHGGSCAYQTAWDMVRFSRISPGAVSSGGRLHDKERVRMVETVWRG